MTSICVKLSPCLFAALFAVCSPAAGQDTGLRTIAQKEWVERQRASAELMVEKLDMTSFSNSIGPRRKSGEQTLSQYGFTSVSTFDDGWAYARIADGSWEFGVFVLNDGRLTKRLCVTDSAVGSGTYHSSIAIEARRQADGIWRSSRLLGPVEGCR